MGLPIIPNPLCDTCQRCFPEDETPDIIYVGFSGIESGLSGEGIEPPNGWYQLPRIGDCEWSNLFEPWQAWVKFDATGTQISLNSFAWYYFAFGASSENQCEYSLPNEQTVYNDEWFINGTANIVTRSFNQSAGAAGIASLLNISLSEDTNYEFFDAPSDTMVHRFANRTDRMNVKIKLDKP